MYVFRYRKVVGDSCQGGAEDQFKVEMVSCPIKRKLTFFFNNYIELSVTVVGMGRAHTVLRIQCCVFSRRIFHCFAVFMCLA